MISIRQCLGTESIPKQLRSGNQSPRFFADRSECRLNHLLLNALQALVCQQFAHLRQRFRIAGELEWASADFFAGAFQDQPVITRHQLISGVVAEGSEQLFASHKLP